MFYLGLVEYMNGITISYLDDFTGAVEIVGYYQDREAAGKEDYVSHGRMIILRPRNYSNFSGDSSHSKLKEERL
jgi:hypothetical protein